MTELEQLKQVMASIDEKVKKAQADAPSNTDQRMSEMFNYCYDMIGRLRDYVYQVEANTYDMFRKHEQGHLPPIKGAGKMEKALEKLGMADDYNVSKPTIWVSANRTGQKEYNIILPLKK